MAFGGSRVIAPSIAGFLIAAAGAPATFLVSAAGASGMKASGPPTVIAHPDGGLSVILPLDGCHMSVHTMPSRELAILDVIALPPHDPRRALDVIARKLTAKSVRAEQKTRG